jgi:uncharacterized protein (TIGR02266 family)
MAPETRKDPRAKVLTMTVRYKSATVDEFIEHHSHDVSRGGIYIKTPSPFLPGTLLKFEIKIADDKAMLSGVGRVVWKRDAASATPEKPAGMGVKFIKVDEASRHLIDKLVNSKGAIPSAYDAEDADEAVTAPAPPVASAPQTTRSTPPTPPQGVALPTPAPEVAGKGEGPVRKATILGLGAAAVQAALEAQRGVAPPAQPAPPPAPEPMFPTTDSVADMPPPEERTVMKQAAELLEEALREAGGSVDGSDTASAAAAPAPAAPADKSGRKAEPAKAEASPASGRPGAAAKAAPKADGAERSAAAAKGSPSPVRTPVADFALPVTQKEGSKRGKLVISLMLVAGAAAAVFVFLPGRDQAPPPAAEPPAVLTPPPPPAPAPPPAPTPPVAAADAQNAVPVVASAAPPASVSGAVAAPSAPNAVETPTAAKPAVVPPPPKPVVAEKPAAAPVEKPAAAPVEKPAPAPKPVAVEKPAPAPKPAAVEKPAPAPKPAPVEKPAPAPKPKPADDNPY